MSKLSGLQYEILEMLEQGDRPIKIATLLNIPLNMVYEVLEEQEQTENYSPFETVNS
mgnify:CR=1 FL=1